MMRILLLGGALLLSFLGVVQEAFAKPPSAYEGRRLYVSYCQLCHGSDGSGDRPLAKTMKINPIDLKKSIRARSDTILKKIISGRGRQTITGRDRHNLISDAMPEWKDVFSDEQIDELIAYLRFLGSSKHRLMGNPETGYQLYQKYCQVCHGEEGGGDGIMTTLMGIEPMDHSNPNETNSISNDILIASILEGRGRYMPAWEGVLTQSEVEALVSYIRLLSH